MPRGGQVSTCVRAAVAQSAAPCCCRRFLLGCRVNATSQLGAAVLVLCEQPVVCIVGWKLGLASVPWGTGACRDRKTAGGRAVGLAPTACLGA